MSERTQQTQDKYVLRLPDGMRDRIKAAAEANNRSMNAEIVAVLEREYPTPLPETSSNPIMKMLLQEIAKIRAGGTVKPGSLRSELLQSYERAARELLARLPANALDEEE